MRKTGAILATGSPQVWLYTLAVALLPLLVLWHRDNALFAPPWYADSWFYLGFFRSLLEFKRDLFLNSYYGSRLSWVLPGYLIHSAFSPVVANCVMHLSVQSVATLSLFSTLRLTAGVRRAFLATMVFSVQPWLWAATGWDYPDGGGIAYTLLAMALFTHSAMRPAWKWSLTFAGMAVAGMVFLHLFLGSLAPLLLLYYIGAAWAWRRTPPGRAAARLLVWAGAGFGLVTAAFCFINFRLDGNPWFYAPSFAQARSMSANFRYFRPVWTDRQLVPWLWPAVGGSIAALTLLPSRLRREFAGRNAAALLFSAQLLLALAYLAYLQSRGSTVMGHYPYVSYLLPFAFLAMGVSFWPAVDAMSPRAYGTICLAAAAIFAAVWFDRRGPLASASLATWHVSLAFCGCALALALLLRRRKAGTWLALAGSAAYCSLSMIQTTSLGWGNMHGDREQYRRIMQAREEVESARQDWDIRFWYDRKEPAFEEYFALNATYLAEFKRLGTAYPYDCGDPIDHGTLAVVSSRDRDLPRTAERALAACWRPFGLIPAIERIDDVRGPSPYSIAMVRAEYDFSAIRPLRVDFDSLGKGSLSPVRSPQSVEDLPAMRWIPVGEADLRNSPEGVLVQAPREPEAYDMTYGPLVAPQAGKYRFIVSYTPIAGNIVFGAAHPNRPEWIATQFQGRRAGGLWERSIELSLKSGEEVVLRVSCHSADGRGPASLLVDRLTAFLVDQ